MKGKIIYFLDNLYNVHMVNGATLFGVSLGLYGLMSIPQLNVNRTIFGIAFLFFFLLALYEMLVKGVIVYLYKKEEKK